MAEVAHNNDPAGPNGAGTAPEGLPPQAETAPEGETESPVLPEDAVGPDHLLTDTRAADPLIDPTTAVPPVTPPDDDAVTVEETTPAGALVDEPPLTAPTDI